MLSGKKCERCKCSDWNCICERVDKFFEDCESLKPFNGEIRPLAPVYDLNEFRLTGKKRML